MTGYRHIQGCRTHFTEQFSPKITEAGDDKGIAFKIQADRTLLPSITADAGLDKQKESTTNDGARNDNKTTVVTLEQIIYSGGKNSALRDQSKQVKSMAEMIIADGENNAVGELYARFYNVLLQKERIKAEESAVAHPNSTSKKSRG